MIKVEHNYTKRKHIIQSHKDVEYLDTTEIENKMQLIVRNKQTDKQFIS